MSPMLFTLYIDKLINEIIAKKVGCYIGNVCSAVFVYADDIILLAPTRKAMQILLKTCEEFRKDYGIMFNPDKCECILFGKSEINMNLIFEGRLLKFGHKVKHLGHVLCCSDDIFDTDVVINDLKVRTNIIMSQFSFLDMDSRIKLINTNCSSYYGSQLMN